MGVLLFYHLPNPYPETGNSRAGGEDVRYMSDSIGISLLGHGVVGAGVSRILTEQRELLRQRTGLWFDLRHVVVRDPAKHKARNKTKGNPLPLNDSAEAAIDDPQVGVVIELMGGIDRPAELIARALRAGKPVVTANKSLLALRGPELFALARQHNTVLAFEASCGGGIPIIDALTRGLVANQTDALVGIVNGTCNFILTRMTENGQTYQQALADAQAAGFAEADPTLDVSGRDAAQKLTLLGGLAFDARLAESDVYVEGIEKIQPADIAFASELGYVIKLLAIAQRVDGGKLSLRVHPTLVHKQDMLADVAGSFNAVSVYGHALGHAFFYGRGAGQMPTASAVVADLVSVATGSAQKTFSQLRRFSDLAKPPILVPFEQLQGRYYLRLMARDEPGVLAGVTEALGKNGISLSAILQRESHSNQHVPVVITTHLSREGSVRKALQAIDALPTIQPPTVCLRILDMPGEFGAEPQRHPTK